MTPNNRDISRIYWYPVVDGPEPELYVGDRLLAIVTCRDNESSPLRPRLTILTATETGWENEYGFTLEDCDLWAYERQIVQSSPVVAAALDSKGGES